MAYTHKLIGSSTVGSGGAANIEFNSIPQTYSDLKLFLSVRYSGSDTDSVVIGLNGSSTTYNTMVLRGTGSTSQSFSFSAGGAGGSTTGSSGSSQTINTFTNTFIYFPYYTDNNAKMFFTEFAQEANVTSAFLGFYGGLSNVTQAISAITISPGSGTWVQHSTAYLYGITNS